MIQQDGTETVVAECDLDAPPETVWRALTEPALLAAWLLPNDIRPEVGHRFTLQAPPGDGGDIRCEVEAADPPRLLRFTWRSDDRAHDSAGRPLESTVTVVLARIASGGTHLRLVHSGLPASGRLAQRLAGAGLAISMLLQPPLRLAA
jgi:uncharacterized protein YndB with AHSA1/START domain